MPDAAAGCPSQARRTADDPFANVDGAGICGRRRASAGGRAGARSARAVAHVSGGCGRQLQRAAAEAERRARELIQNGTAPWGQCNMEIATRMQESTRVRTTVALDGIGPLVDGRHENPFEIL